MAVNYVLIGEFTTSVSTASVTLSNIPQTGYSDIKIVGSTRDDRTAFGSSPVVITHINGTSVTGVTVDDLGTNGTGVFGQTYGQIWAGQSTRIGHTANTFGVWDCYIPNYSVAGIVKTFTSDGAGETNATEAGISLSGSSWTGTAAISSLTFTPSYATVFLANSTFYVYGIAALGTTPTILPKATGGDIVVNDGTYWYHAFLASGTFTPNQTLSCDALVIAGGGGASMGGGGAGGLLAFTSQSLSTTNYAVTIGAGGAGQRGEVTQGTNGVSSVFQTLTATTGGGGGGDRVSTGTRNGKSGGSGGGGGYYFGAGAGGAASPSGQGNAGASSPQDNYTGGGGGAGAVGSGTTSNANGGNGLSTYSSWGSATVTGQNISSTYWYAGGGGGFSSNPGSTTTVGGNGGGGNGVASGAANAGTPNTGGGGGGNLGTSDSFGGNGGSGLVIVRYTMA
jgi:hypothetical protein